MILQASELRTTNTTDDTWSAGRGELTVERIDDRSRLTQSRATAPLKLLSPQQPGPAVWIYATTFGGGLVAGDAIDLRLHVGADAVCVLTTQASTKVYRQQNGLGASQRLAAHVAPQATLVVVPDPLVCFENAIYRQHQHVQLQRGGNLVLLDWFTAGRVAYGERWVFSRYASRNELAEAGKTVASDALLLDPEDGPLTDIARMGWYDCVATLLIAGERFESLCNDLVEQVQRMPVAADAELIVAASRTPWGAMLRAAGRTTELVAEELKIRLAFLRDLLGVAPWDRKW